MKTLSDLFRINAERYGSLPCLQVYQPEYGSEGILNFSYGRFYQALLRQARQLREVHRLQKADTIALLADNSLSYLLLSFAAPLIGVRVLLVSTKVLPEHLQHFLLHTNCKLLFVSETYRKQAVNSACPWVLLDASPPPPESDAAKEADITFSPDQDDCALIMHTSGTTSTPRLVYLPHRDILLNQRAVDASIGKFWTGSDSSLLFLPLFHGYALLSQFLRNCYIGARTVLLQQSESPSAANLAQAVERTGVTFFCCVPWMLKLLHEQVLGEQSTGNSPTLRVLQHLKFIVTAGAPLDQGTGEFFAANGIRVISVFGLTEAAGFVLHSSFENFRWDLLHPIMDERISFVPDSAGNTTFELVLASSASGSSEKTGTDAPFRTCDLFRSSPEGWVYLGRNDLMYNGPHGEKINPVLFETALEQDPGVARVFVTGEDMLFNAALVQLEADYLGRETEILRLRNLIQSKINPALELPARVYPNDVFFLGPHETIPITPKGTIERKAARDLLIAKMSQASSAGSQHLSPDEIAALVRDRIRAYLKLDAGHEIPDSTGLLELGFDSLMLLSLRNSLQQQLDAEIPLDLMLGFPQVGALISSLSDLQGKKPKATVQVGNAANTDADGWANIPLEQVIFHTAHYTFPFPTYNVSMSLLAPDRISLADIRKGMEYLEAKHEILRAVFRPEGTYRIEKRSFAEQALLGSSDIQGSHDIFSNPDAQALIRDYLNCSFNLSEGPVYRYAVINITDASGLTRTLIYMGLNHIAGDFKGFNSLLGELMEYLSGNAAPPVQGDNYSALVAIPSNEDLKLSQDSWRSILTVMPELKEGLDFRAGHKHYFKLADVNLREITHILRKHNISLYNGIYTVYIQALSRHLPNLTVEDFQSATCVTSRITPETETLMGCFIQCPLLRFHLDQRQNLKQMMTAVQDTTTRAFSKIINNPVAYLQDLVADPTNLPPFITRNVLLYRSPDEFISPLAGWDCYRNEFFFDNCDVGMYLDFFSNPRDHAMEGYVLINLHYCEPEVIQPILADIESLLRHMVDHPDLDFSPALLLE